MDTAPLKEIVNELLSSLESLEAQSAGVLEFLKSEKRGTGKKLAPFLEQAAEASNVRYRAARLRMERLFAELERQEEKAGEQSKEVELAAPQAKETEQAAQAKPEVQSEPAAVEGKRATPSEEKSSPAPAETADGSPAKVNPHGPEPVQRNATKAEERTDSTASQPGDGANLARPSDKTASDQPKKDAA
jgi:hypothetical protein